MFPRVLTVCAVMVAAGPMAMTSVAGVAEPKGSEAARAERVRPDAQAEAARREAERVIEGASAQADALIKWLSERGAKLSSDAQAARVKTEAWLKEQVAAALSKPPAFTGVRVLGGGAAAVRAGGGGGAELVWTPMDEAGAAAGFEGGVWPERVVLLVHGLDESGSIWDDLGPMVQERGLAVARFDYPNDQRIAQSADELVDALAGLKKLGVRRVDIVAHSMGGLVARDALTRAEHYAGDAGGSARLPRVERLIAVATPNHGAALAWLRGVAELREQLERYASGDLSDARALLGFLKDGAGEAGEDLRPDSAFLNELNARGLPKGVRITLVAGSAAGGVESGVDEVLKWPVLRQVWSAEELSAARKSLTDLADVVGDGVVPLESVRLAGVEDFVVIPAQHRMMLRRPEAERELREAVGEAPRIGSAVPIVLDRLSK